MSLHCIVQTDDFCFEPAPTRCTNVLLHAGIMLLENAIIGKLTQGTRVLRLVAAKRTQAQYVTDIAGQGSAATCTDVHGSVLQVASGG